MYEPAVDATSYNSEVRANVGLLLAASLVVAACSSLIRPTEPPASALPHQFPDLEARLPSTYAGKPVPTTSYDSEFAVGNEDLYSGVFNAITTVLLPASGTPLPDLDRLQVAEAFLDPPYPYAVVVQAFRVPGAGPGYWNQVIDTLLRGGLTGVTRIYRPTPVQRRQTFEGTPGSAVDEPSLVIVSGDTLYELTGSDLATLYAVADTVP